MSEPVKKPDFSIGDLVTKRAGAYFKAEVRSIFKSHKGQQLVALEYPSGLFRIVRPQQLRKVEDEE